jgi:uncharacterized protein YraI
MRTPRLGAGDATVGYPQQLIADWNEAQETIHNDNEDAKHIQGISRCEESMERR